MTELNAVTRVHSKGFEIPDISRFGFILTPTGMISKDSPTFEQWKACGKWLRSSERAFAARLGMIQFAIGDWLNYGEKHYGQCKEAARMTGFDDGTLRNLAYVARRFELSSRNYSVPFKHYQLAAPNKDRNRWLEYASEEKWSAEELREHMHRSTNGKQKYEPAEGISHNAPPPPDGDEVEGKYNLANHGEQLRILLMDCNGAFRVIESKSDSADIREICVAMRGRIDDLLAEL